MEAGLVGFSHVEQKIEINDIVKKSIFSHIAQQHKASKNINVPRRSSDSIPDRAFPSPLLPVISNLLVDPCPEILILISMELHRQKLKWPSIFLPKILHHLPNNSIDNKLIISHINSSFLAYFNNAFNYQLSKSIEDFDQLKAEEIAIFLKRRLNEHNANQILRSVIDDISLSRFRTVLADSDRRVRELISIQEEPFIIRKFIRGIRLEQELCKENDKYINFYSHLMSFLNESEDESELPIKLKDYKCLENVNNNRALSQHKILYNFMRILRPADLMKYLETDKTRLKNFFIITDHKNFRFNCMLESALLHRDSEVVNALLMCMIHIPVLEIFNDLYGMLREQLSYAFFQRFTSICVSQYGLDICLKRCAIIWDIRYFSWSKKTSTQIMREISSTNYFLHNDMMEVEEENLRKLVLHLHSSALTPLGNILEQQYGFAADKLSYWKSILYLRKKLTKELRKWQKKKSNT